MYDCTYIFITYQKYFSCDPSVTVVQLQSQSFQFCFLQGRPSKPPFPELECVNKNREYLLLNYEVHFRLLSTRKNYTILSSFVEPDPDPQ